MQNNEEQQLALNKVRDGKNVSILGSSGVGKSYTIKQLDDGATIFMAPTGIAALNIGGITMHSALGLPIGYPTEDDLVSKSKKLTTLFGPNSDIRRIVLDETYMCRADSFDMIDTKLRLVRKVDKPFGGIQMVLTGDPFQLEPIVDDKVKPFIERDYKSPYCFDSNAWHEGAIDMVALRKVMRQSDEQQIALLNSIRTKDENYLESLQKIQDIAKPYERCINTLHLCAYNQQADKVNYFWYNKLASQEYTFKGFGNFAPHEVMVDYELKLKVGARVLICANDVENNNYVNGERGIITSILGGDVYVMKDDGVEVLVAPFTWQKYDYEMTLRGLQKKVIAEYTQLPLKLGYAISVHKSQGMSLDDVAIDFGRGSFAAGQTYVALSRIRNLRNLSFVRPLKPEDVIVNRRVKEFYQSIQGTFK